MYSTHVLYTGAQDLGTVDILHKFIDAIYFKDVLLYVTGDDLFPASFLRKSQKKVHEKIRA